MSRNRQILAVLLGLATLCHAPSQGAEEGRAAEEGGNAPAKAPESDEVTRLLAERILAAQRQSEAGEREKALQTLDDAKKLAAEHQRPEEGLIQARIIRLKQEMEEAAAPAKPEGEAAAVAAPEGDGALLAAPLRAPAKDLVLTLEECIEIAVQNNLGLRLSRLSDRANDLDLEVAWAQYRPSFGISAKHSGGRDGEGHGGTTSLTSSVTQEAPWGTRVTLSGSESFSNPGSRATDWGVSVAQPLWRGSGFDVGLHDIRVARLTKLISRGSLELDVQDLIFNVRSSYANCVRQIQTLEVNQRAVKSAQTFLDLTRARERAGQVTRLDVFNAEVQLADRELALTANIRALENAFDFLKQIMDVDLEESVGVVQQRVEFGENPGANEDIRIETDEKSGTVLLVKREQKEAEIARPDGTKIKTTVVGDALGKPETMFQATRFDEATILRESLQNRLDLLNSRRTTAIRKLNALLARDGLGHQIDLVASYGRSKAGDTFAVSHGLEDYDYSAEIKYSLPWGKIADRASYERALLDLQRSEIQLKQARTQVHLDVRVILRTLRETEKSILIQGKKVEQAKRSVEAAQISFERGLKDSFDVIRAEDNLLSAKTDFINRRLDYVVRLAELETVVGKPTGRVDLSARHPGGLIDGTLPETLREKGLPASAPTADPRVEDDPFEHQKARKDWEKTSDPESRQPVYIPMDELKE
ncbi:MAG: TolC family protein [Planctomycetota bacterium]|nr:TolC family protein [Planctomycetota bacterium]